MILNFFRLRKSTIFYLLSWDQMMEFYACALLVLFEFITIRHFVSSQNITLWTSKFSIFCPFRINSKKFTNKWILYTKYFRSDSWKKTFFKTNELFFKFSKIFGRLLLKLIMSLSNFYFRILNNFFSANLITYLRVYFLYHI